MMDDSALEYYSYLPVLGSDGSVVALPVMGVQNSQEGAGDLSVSSVSPVADPSSDLQADKSDVQVVQDINSLAAESALAASAPSLSASSLPEIGVTAPDDLLFYGSVWIHGIDDHLGEITVYFPVDSKNSWGLDSSGRLVYIGNSSMSGYLSGVYNNSLMASSFSRPRYRTSESYNYSYLSLVPDNSNAPIAVSDAPRVGLSDAIPIFIAVCMGVVVLFISKLHR